MVITTYTPRTIVARFSRYRDKQTVHSIAKKIKRERYVYKSRVLKINIENQKRKLADCETAKKSQYVWLFSIGSYCYEVKVPQATKCVATAAMLHLFFLINNPDLILFNDLLVCFISLLMNFHCLKWSFEKFYLID